MKPTLNVIAWAGHVTGAVLLISSFFVEDNTKAVKRRWYAVGAFAVGIGARIAAGKTGTPASAEK